MRSAVPDVLVFGDTVRSPEMRHEIPLPVPDPFLYVERDGRRVAVVGSLEVPRLRELPGLEARPHEDFGLDELIAAGVEREDLYLHLSLRACRDLGVARAVVPPSFPTALADHLRANGLELVVDRALFSGRRRRKSEVELAGIRRAQRACEAAMDAARDLLRRAVPANGVVTLDGEPLTCERLKGAIADVFAAHGACAEEFIVSHGPQSAIGHEMGSGPIAPGEPIVIDIWPKDRETACYADMTRTFVVGDAPERLREYHRLTLEALELARGLVRPGVDGRSVHDAVCDHFEAHGHRTTRSKADGEVLRDGFIHGLGHGVGLEVHERPSLGRFGDVLVAGDVVTIEPGLYRAGWGGVRLEDLLLVTEDGAETLTDFPYDLDPWPDRARV